ncbi:MAG: sigma-70 family RNA polymerase sigma factor [Planctomycetota bacterium]|nr:sigma-70 family RNA polymerase sigma factor [Planctomycetota bacterium]
MSSAKNSATDYLLRIGEGDDSASEGLMELLYDDLRAIASRMMHSERPNHTLQPTAVVHEAYLRLIDQKHTDWKNRAHFLAVSAEIIRRILIDYARKQNAAKRGGNNQRVTLDNHLAMCEERDLDLLALDEAMNRLALLNERQTKVIELRFYGGMTEKEVATVLGVSRTTIADDWSVARAWLSRELSGEQRP